MSDHTLIMVLISDAARFILGRSALSHQPIGRSATTSPAGRDHIALATVTMRIIQRP